MDLKNEEAIFEKDQSDLTTIIGGDLTFDNIVGLMLKVMKHGSM
jgi:hypothetical protein